MSIPQIVFDPGWRIPPPIWAESGDRGKWYQRLQSELDGSSFADGAARNQVCLAHLDRIRSELAAGMASLETTTDLLRTQSVILLELAQFSADSGDRTAAYERAREALEVATQCGANVDMYRALKLLGHLEYWDAAFNAPDPETAQPHYDNAAVYFQRALVYSNYLWPKAMTDTLRALAEVWDKSQHTAAQAMGIYDCLFVMDPRDLHSLEGKFRCLAEVEPEEFDEIALRKKFDSAASALETAAANFVVRRTNSAKAAVRRGLALARQEGASVLERTFELLLGLDVSASGKPAR